MRFLVDSCVSIKACNALRKMKNEVLWVPDIYKDDPGDEVIIDKALKENLVLITGDKDFGEWIFLKGKSQPPLIRLASMSPKNQEILLIKIVEKYVTELKNGALITATKNKVRIRKNTSIK